MFWKNFTEQASGVSGTNPFVITSGSDAKYVSFSLGLATYNSWKETLQIEYEEMRPYSPYFKPYYKVKDIPTKVSQLENDNNYVKHDDILNSFESKNLLNPSLLEVGYSINSSNGEEIANSDYVIWRNIPVISGKTIYLSKLNGVPQEPNPLAIYKKDGSYIGAIGNGATIPNDGYYAKVVLGIPTYNANKSSLMLQYDEITNYEPYFDSYSIVKDDLLTGRQKEKNQNVLSIAHQGYATDGKPYGYSKLEAFVNASHNGFDYGETDLIFSSDEVAFCCHDGSFVDGTSGETIDISQHTSAELKTYNYHGSTIATFDEVVKTCKESGIGLVIDHVTEADSGNRFTNVMNTVKKYQMQNNVIWSVGRESMIDTLIEWNKKVKIVIPVSSSSDLDRLIAFANRKKTDFNEIGFSLATSAFTVQGIQDFISLIPASMFIHCWTVDDKETYYNYLPYVTGIYSNKLSTYLLEF